MVFNLFVNRSRVLELVLLIIVIFFSLNPIIINASIIIGGTQKNPTVIDNVYYDHRYFDDTKASPLPATGMINYYASGVMNLVWHYRYTIEKYIYCNECVGYAAMMRDGDKKSKVCIVRSGSTEIEGPFHVIDVAKDTDKKTLIEKQNWLVDVDWNTAKSWNMNGPKLGKLVNCPENMTPKLISLSTSNFPKKAKLLYNSNIRLSPNLTGTIIKVLPKDTIIEVKSIDSTGLWYKLNYDSDQFIYSSLITFI